MSTKETIIEIFRKTKKPEKVSALKSISNWLPLWRRYRLFSWASIAQSIRHYRQSRCTHSPLRVNTSAHGSTTTCAKCAATYLTPDQMHAFQHSKTRMWP